MKKKKSPDSEVSGDHRPSSATSWPHLGAEASAAFSDFHQPYGNP